MLDEIEWLPLVNLLHPVECSAAALFRHCFDRSRYCLLTSMHSYFNKSAEHFWNLPNMEMTGKQRKAEKMKFHFQKSNGTLRNEFELQFISRICASQIVTKIRRNVFSPTLRSQSLDIKMQLDVGNEPTL